jgi:hypothetical protein
MAINQKRPDTPLAATPEPRFMAVNDTIKPKVVLTPRQKIDSIKTEKRKIIYKKSYDESKEKQKGDSFEQWYNKFDQRTKENSYKAKEPKGDKTFFAGDNGPKSPCKGGACMKSN